MNRNILLSLCTMIAILACISACRKKSSGSPSPSTSSSRLPNAVTGSRVFIGDGYTDGQPPLPDMFVCMQIAVINDTAISVDGIKLPLKSANGASITFEAHPFFYDYTDIIYSKTDQSLQYYSIIGDGLFSASQSLSTAKYKPDPSVHSYVQNITGSYHMTWTTTNSHQLTF